MGRHKRIVFDEGTGSGHSRLATKNIGPEMPVVTQVETLDHHGAATGTDTEGKKVAKEKDIIPHILHTLENEGELDNDMKMNAQYGVSRTAVETLEEHSMTTSGIITMGVQLSFDDPVHLDKRTQDVVVCRHVNYERDTSMDIPLSSYNLSHVGYHEDSEERPFGAKILAQYFPDHIILDLNLISDVVDQTSLALSAVCAVSHLIEFVMQKHLKDQPSWIPSLLYLYYYVRDNKELDSSCSISDVIQSYKLHNVCSEIYWPMIVRRFTTEPSAEAQQNASKHELLDPIQLSDSSLRHDHIRKCLKDGYPVVFSLAIYLSFFSEETVRTGRVTFPLASDKRIGGHCFMIHGYDDERRIYWCMNSMGEKWGNNGIALIDMDYVHSDKHASHFWTMR
jgi:hypothetical protein